MGGQKSAELKKKQKTVIGIHVGNVGGENPMDMLKAVMEKGSKPPEN